MFIVILSYKLGYCNCIRTIHCDTGKKSQYYMDTYEHND